MNMVSGGGSRPAATSKMELFVIIVNGFHPLTIITKCSILDVAAVLDPPLVSVMLRTQLIVLLFILELYPILPLLHHYLQRNVGSSYEKRY